MRAAMFERLSVRDVLTRLGGADAGAGAGAGADEGGGLTMEVETRVREALVAFANSQTPWYLRVVIGVGAWFGSIFLLSFIIGFALLGAGEAGAPIVGCVLIAGATVLRRSAGTSQFLRQVALVVVFTGQALLIGGIGDLSKAISAACVATLVVSAALIAVFPDRVQRFVSTLASVAAVMTMVFELKIRMGADVVALGLLLVVLLVWRVAPRAAMEEASEIAEPVVHGLVISLFGILLTDVLLAFADPSELWLLRLWLPVRIGFVVALLWLASMILIEQGLPLQRPEAMLTLAAILLLGWLTRSTPAIVATIAILALAFDRRSRGLIALSTAFLLGFGGVYYYSLRLTLLEKSGVLVMSGVLCLVACAALKWRVRDVAA